MFLHFFSTLVVCVSALIVSLLILLFEFILCVRASVLRIFLLPSMVSLSVRHVSPPCCLLPPPAATTSLWLTRQIDFLILIFPPGLPLCFYYYLLVKDRLSWVLVFSQTLISWRTLQQKLDAFLLDKHKVRTTAGRPDWPTYTVT